MTMETQPFVEDVSPITFMEIFRCHVSFEGKNTPQVQHFDPENRAKKKASRKPDGVFQYSFIVQGRTVKLYGF